MKKYIIVVSILNLIVWGIVIARTTIKNPYDLNLDGKIDIADISILISKTK